ncbi:MAG: paraquat-inducible protein A [Pikeienuella sp.]
MTDTTAETAPVPLIACYSCDALLHERTAPQGSRVRCPRCHVILTAERHLSIDSVLTTSFATLVLLAAALSLPFISLSAGGRMKDAAVLDAAFAAGGDSWLLAIAVGAMIALIPAMRACALLYTLLPLRVGAPAFRHARAAFRLAIELRPWSMMEIFVIGVAVALVKVADLATIGLGSAFWLFVVLGALTVIEDASLCRRTVWRMIG